MIPTYLEKVYPDMILSDIDWESKPKTCPGDRYEPIYSPVIDASGRFELKEKKEKIDVYSAIQSYKDSVDINRVIDRLKSGDTSDLNKWSGFFEDVSDLPDNLAAWLQMQSDAEIAFYDLPLEVREKFNHDPQQFFYALSKGDVDSMLSDSDSEPQASDSVPEPLKDGDLNE